MIIETTKSKEWPNGIPTITPAEWRKTPRDYRGYINGRPYVVANRNGATELTPVEIVSNQE